MNFLDEEIQILNNIIDRIKESFFQQKKEVEIQEDKKPPDIEIKDIQEVKEILLEQIKDKLSEKDSILDKSDNHIDLISDSDGQ